MRGVKKDIVRSVRKPGSPEAFVLHTCKNCGFVFEGNFCPSCGQSVVEVQKPISHFLGDLFGTMYALDIRMIRTVPVLLFKPGKLSAEYIEGKRASHVAPFRLYFLASLIFFFLIGLQTKNAVNEALEENPDLIVSDSLVGKGTSVRLGVGGDSIVDIKNLRDGLSLMEMVSKEITGGLKDSTLTEKERAARERKLKAYENPEVLISKVYQYVSYSFFLLMPLFGAILFLFFHKKRKFYVEHLIYSVNLHTFFFLVAIFALLIGMIFPTLLDKIGGFIFLLTVIYSIIGIRNFYKTSWRSAIFSSLALFTLYLMCVTAVLVLGAIILLG